VDGAAAGCDLGARAAEFRDRTSAARRAVRASGHLVFGAPLAVIGFVAGLLGLNAQTYARLTMRAPSRR